MNNEIAPGTKIKVVKGYMKGAIGIVVPCGHKFAKPNLLILVENVADFPRMTGPKAFVLTSHVKVIS